MVPIERLVEQSDLVVVGTLDNVKERSDGGTDYGEGDIAVAEVLSGDAKSGGKLHLVWQNRSQVICPRISHLHNAGKPGIWFLTRSDKEQVEANHSRRFVSIERKAEIIGLIEARRKKATKIPGTNDGQ
jgi:hypothetical protein